MGASIHEGEPSYKAQVIQGNSVEPERGNLQEAQQRFSRAVDEWQPSTVKEFLQPGR